MLQLWGDALGGHLFVVYLSGLRICKASGADSAAMPLLRCASDAALATAFALSPQGAPVPTVMRRVLSHGASGQQPAVAGSQALGEGPGRYTAQSRDVLNSGAAQNQRKTQVGWASCALLVVLLGCTACACSLAQMSKARAVPRGQGGSALPRPSMAVCQCTTAHVKT